MNKLPLYELSPEARERWTTWLKARLHASNGSQKSVAIKIDDAQTPDMPGQSKRSEVSRFFNGDPATLRRWFTERESWLEALAEELMLSTDQLRETLQRLGAGEDPNTAAWHPSFPELSLEDVEIPAALEGESGSSLAQVIAALVQGPLGPERLSPGRGWSPLTLIGPPGAARDIAVRQVKSQLEAALGVWLLEARQAYEGQKAQHRRAEAPSPVRVELSHTLNASSQKGVVSLQVVTPEQVNYSPQRRLTLTPWGPEQAKALAQKLSECDKLRKPAREKLRAFHALLNQHPAAVDSEASPDLVIRLMATVAQKGCPRDVIQTRDLMARAAWEQAKVKGEQALEPLDERIMDTLMARLAARSRSHPADVRSWTEAPEPVVVDLLREILRERLGHTAGRPLEELLSEAEQRSGQARVKAFAALRAALARDATEDVLEALVKSQVFVRERRATGPVLRLRDPIVAAIWAARGLGEAPDMQGQWSRLLDPAWLSVLDELGRRGLSGPGLARWLASCPPELAIDRAVWTVRLASTMPGAMPIAQLRPAWTTAVWAQAHGMFVARHSYTSVWESWLPNTLRRVSWRYKKELPVFDEDPVAELGAALPEGVREQVGRWRFTPSEQRSKSTVWEGGGLMPFSYICDAQTLRHRVCEVCPAQVVPTRPWSWEWCQRRQLEKGLERLVERAAEGCETARRLVDGRDWLDQDLPTNRRSDPHRTAQQIWVALPLNIKTRFAPSAAHTSEDAARLLWVLVHSLEQSPDEAVSRSLKALAEMAGDEALQAQCVRILLEWPQEPQGPHALDWALSVAKEYRLLDLLGFVSSWPERVLPKCRVRLRRYEVWLEGPSALPRRLKVRMEVQVPETIGWATIDTRNFVHNLESLAHRASVALYQLGEPEALRRRWQEGPLWLTDLPLWRDLDRVEALLTLTGRNLNETPDPIKGLAPLHAYGNKVGPRAAPEERWRHTSRRDGYPALPLHILRHVEKGLLRESLLPIAWGALALLEELPEELDSALEQMLRDPLVLRQYPPAHGRNASVAIASWSTEAIYALLTWGNREPLNVWLHAHHNDDAQEHDRDTASVVEGWLGRDNSRLKEAWDLVQQQAGAGRLQATRRTNLEWSLLYAGSVCKTSDGPEAHVEAPLPFVLEQARTTQNQEWWMRLHELNHKHPAWAEVIEHRLRHAPDPRTRAALALDLRLHRPDTPTLTQSLKYWALEDPDPFLGGPTFDWRGGRAVGGAEDLLKHLTAIREDWVVEGLRRLWGLALCLPIGQVPQYTTWRWDEDPPAERMVLPGGGLTPPSLIAALLGALEQHGLVDEIIKVWKDPPRDPPPEHAEERFQEGGRPDIFRQWVFFTYLRLAPNDALEDDLRPDPDAAPRQLLYETLNRPISGLGEVWERRAVRAGHNNFRPLSMVGPERILPLLERQLADPQPNLAGILGLAVDDLSVPNFLHLPALLWLRRAVLELSPPEDQPSHSPSSVGDTHPESSG